MTGRIRTTPSVPWAITFADMALLLLCFFIMLSSDRASQDVVANVPAEAQAPGSATKTTAALLRERFAAEIDHGWLTVDENGSSLMLRFGMAGGFDRGSDSLTPLTVSLIDTLTRTLSDSNARVVVSGHTDDMPIRTERFRDNWDLSTARSVSVIRALLSYPGMDPARLEAKGYADTQPLAPNDTDLNRLRNRRIEIEVSW